MGKSAALSAVIVAAVLSAYAQPADADSPAAQPPGQATVILDGRSFWRMHATARTPVVRLTEGAELTEALASSQSGSVEHWRGVSAAPPADWFAPDFADWSWPGTRSFGPGSGFIPHLVQRTFSCPTETIWVSPALAVQCVRGKFRVPDPGRVRGLSLSVAYRGGIVVRVNGAEVSRGHLPAGPIQPETPAEEYPQQAFARFVGRQLDKQQPIATDLRVRRLDNLAISADLLRNATNVLALEVHRAPFFGPGLEREDYNTWSAWATAGLVDVQLRAEAGIESNVARPEGVQVWNWPTTEWIRPSAWGDPAEGVGPIELVGVRNGAFCGQVVVSSPGGLKAVRAEVSQLVHQGAAARIAADNVSVFYVAPAGWLLRDSREKGELLWDTLAEQPPAEVQPAPVPRGQVAGGAVQPIWVKARVPADALPGDYHGRLTVRADSLAPVEVPVRLKVINFTLPDPRDYLTHVGLFQSPDSVAMWYQVPLWSNEHFRLMEQSFRLLGELGNKTVYLPLVCRTNMGNEQGMVRFIREGAEYRRDFTILDRYLDLASRHLKPDVVCLYVFDHESSNAAGSRGGRAGSTWQGLPVSELDPASGQVRQMLAPKLDAPDASQFWQPVFAELSQRLKARGLLGVALPGISNDFSAPSPSVRKMLGEFLPGAPWVVQTHPGSYNEKTPGYFTQVYIRAYSTAMPWTMPQRVVAWRRQRDREGKQDWFLRGFGPGMPLADQRTVLERAFLHNCSGWGRIGADFWPLGQPATRPGTVGTYWKNTTTIAARYPETDWGQLNLERGGPLALLCPGPSGAGRTVRFEVVREGLQESEARIFVERALLEPDLRTRLTDGLANRCEAILQERVWSLKSGAGDMVRLAEKLFATAAEVAARLAG